MTLKELLNVVDNDTFVYVYSYDDLLTGGTAAAVICNAFFDGINSFYYAKLERI